MVSQVLAVSNSKEYLKCKVKDIEFYVTKKETKLKEVLVELVTTQKSMKMMNLRMSKLDHIFDT